MNKKNHDKTLNCITLLKISDNLYKQKLFKMNEHCLFTII